LKLGYSIVRCDQVRKPHTSITQPEFDRNISRIYTPGTLIEENLVDEISNYLLSVYVDSSDVGLAWLDVSTGQFKMTACQIDSSEFALYLSRISPKEIVVDEKQLDLLEPIFKAHTPSAVVSLHSHPGNYFTLQNCKKLLLNTFDGFEVDVFISRFRSVELQASGGLLEYASSSQPGVALSLDAPVRMNSSETMHLDAVTMRSLDLLKNSFTLGSKGTLMDVIDCTSTSSGSRLLSERIRSPWINVARIKEQQSSVEYFYNNKILVSKLRSILEKCKDLERLLSRISYQNLSTGNPNDLKYIAETILNIESIKKEFDEPMCEGLGNYSRMAMEILDSLEEPLPNRFDASRRIIREGFDDKLDKMYEEALVGDPYERKSSLISLYSDLQAIDADKIKLVEKRRYGWCVTVPRDTKINDVNFVYVSSDNKQAIYKVTSLALEKQEAQRIMDERFQYELELYQKQRLKVLKELKGLKLAARTLSELDLNVGLAHLAHEKHFVKPVIDDR
jgi:DNA mismatch repair protein MutS